MKKRRLLAKIRVLATAFVLGFTQVALAAYVCPMGVPEMAHAMASGHDMAMGEEGCHEPGGVSRHLCIKTCHDEPQKNEVASLAALPPSLDEGLRVEPCAFCDAEKVYVADALLARATSPPPLVLFAHYLK